MNGVLPIDAVPEEVDATDVTALVAVTVTVIAFPASSLANV
jgi:hypothetical protein